MNVIRPLPALLKMACLACVVSISMAASSQEPQGKSSSVTTLMRQMTGTWHVISKMWPAAGAKAVLYRLTVGPVESGSQTVRLFLTEQNGEGHEFMAFEYVYRRYPRD